jgi:regulatory protein
MDDGSRSKDERDAAREAAVRLLTRRDLSEAELRERLRLRGHPETTVDYLMPELRDSGYVDDARVAVNGILAGLDAGHARGRIEQKLSGRGLDERTLGLAWERVGTEHPIDDSARLLEQLERRLARVGRPLDDAVYRRVYNAMLRAGFDADEVAAALAPHHSQGSTDGDIL